MTEIDSYHPVARLDLRSCATERVGVDVVALDEDRLHYHTMHEQVLQVLRLSDGTRSADEIAARVFGDADRLHRDATGQALLDLMDAGLIAENAEARERLFSRRAVGKAAAALLLGGVGLPLVKSITAPDAASALTRCGDGGPADPCGPEIGGCQSCCCCFVSPGIVLCADRAACEPTYVCI